MTRVLRIEGMRNCFDGSVSFARGLSSRRGGGANNLFLMVWTMAVDMDEVDSLGVELREERLKGCRGGCEWCWDGVRVALYGRGGFGEGSRGAFADCHDCGGFSPRQSCVW